MLKIGQVKKSLFPMMILLSFASVIYMGRHVFRKSTYGGRKIAQDGQAGSNDRNWLSWGDSTEEGDGHEENRSSGRPSFREFNALRQKYFTEKENLALLAYKIGKAKNLGLPHDELEGPQADLQEEDHILKALEYQLKETRRQISELKEGRGHVFEQLRFNQSEQELQIEYQIQAQENAMNQTQEQIQTLKSQKFDYNAKAEIARFEQILRDQKITHQQLKEQKKILVDQGQVSRNATFVQLQYQEGQLKMTEQQIIQQMNIEKTRQLRIKQDIDDRQKLTNQENNSIQQLEAQYEELGAQVDLLQIQYNKYKKLMQDSAE